MSRIPLPLEPDTLHDEIKALRDILVKWEARMVSIPLPGVDKPGSEEDLLQIMTPLRGELSLVAARAQALADLLETL